MPEVILKAEFVEVDTGWLQETIFEVVQIEHHIGLIEIRLRIADTVVESLTSDDLQARQQPDGILKQGNLTAVILSSTLATMSDAVEEGGRPEVLLQITHAVITDSIYLGNRKLLAEEMARNGYKGVIFFFARSYDPDS